MIKTVKSLLLLSMFSLFAWNSNAQVNIGSGTQTGLALPIEPYYGFTYSQSIYLASEISTSGSITGLTFYGDAGISALTNSSDWVVYLGHTTKSSFANSGDWESGLTQVYSGTVSVVGNNVTITFTTPFVYNGTDNLIVGVDENGTNYDNNSDEFLCTATATDRALTYRSDATNPDPTGTLPTATFIRQAIPNIQFAGITQSCPSPSLLTIANVSSSSADFGWTENGTATTWHIEYGTGGFTPTGTPTVSGATTNPATLTSLTPNTTYDVYVQADCGADSSAWVGPISFTTACASLSAPWAEPFATNALPSCWTQSGDNSWKYGSSATTPTGFAAYGAANTPDHTAGGGGTFIGMDGSDNGNGEISVLLSPVIDVSGLTNGQLSYWVFSNNVNDAALNKLIVDVYDGAAWVQVDSIQQNLGASWIEFTTPLSSLTITGDVQVRFTITGDNSAGGSTYNNDILIDDVSFDEIPSCIAITSLTATNVNATSLDLGWTENGTATVWNIEYGAAGFTPTGTPTETGVTSNPFTVNSLTPETSYDFYVQASCGGSVSTWVGPFTATTPCSVITPAYQTDFSTFMPSCWDEADNGTLATGPTGLGAGSWGQSGSIARINLYTTGKSDWLVSPSFDLSAGGWELAIDASANDYGSTTAFSGMGSDDSVQVVISSDGGATWTEIYSFNSTSQPIFANATYTIDLSAYTGTSNMFGIRATEGTVNDPEDYYFNVSSFEIRVPPSCADPSAITVTNLTGTSADISWTSGNAVQAGWEISIVDAGMPAMGGTAATSPYSATGLTGNTAYDVYVREICAPGDTTGWIGPVSFTTPCETYIPDYAQDFTTYLPACWEEAQGLLTPSTTLTPGTSSWVSDGFANAGSSGAARMNIYTSGQDEWLISPSIDLTGGPFQLEYDVALTTYAGTAATTLDPDDSLAVVISTDNGATWSNANILQVYTAGSEPSNVGERAYIDLSTYTGVVKFGFYAASTQNLTVDNDIFIDNFLVTSLCLPTYGTDVQVACDSLVWIDGNTYTASNNTATFTTTNAAGCDSIVSLDLTITNSTTGTDVQVACDSLIWIDGNTYTANNNTATYTLTTAAGCDSIVTLDLTITNSTTGTDVQAACDTFTWIDGNTYTASNNTATFALTNAAGCDSIVTLDLTITNSTTSTDVHTTCDSLVWIDGNTYTASNNTATYTLTNAAGCDSIVTLDLTVLSPTTSTDVQTTCDSLVWIDGNTYTASNNTATYTLTNAAGCDSIVTLDLTVLSPTTSTDVQTACDSFTWIDGNTYTASNNTATYTLTNAAGCDSIVTLDLTITTVDVSVTLNDPTIMANATGAAYVWLDCDNGNAPIAGETGQSFTATANGNYAVEVTENGCVDTSACSPIVTVSLGETSLFDGVSVYPNPVQNLVNVDLGNLENVTVKLLDLKGKVLFVETKVNESLYSFEMNQVAGVYFVEVSSANSFKRFKVVKE